MAPAATKCWPTPVAVLQVSKPDQPPGYGYTRVAIRVAMCDFLCHILKWGQVIQSNDSPGRVITIWNASRKIRPPPTTGAGAGVRMARKDLLARQPLFHVKQVGKIFYFPCGGQRINRQRGYPR